MVLCWAETILRLIIGKKMHSWQFLDIKITVAHSILFYCLSLSDKHHVCLWIAIAKHFPHPFIPFFFFEKETDLPIDLYYTLIT